MKRTVIVLLICVARALAEDTFDNAGVRIALKVYDECAKAESFSVCLKKRAITFIDRVSRMDNLSVSDGIIVKRAKDAPAVGPAVTEDILDETLPRSEDAKENALDNMMVDEVANFVGSRTIEISLPRLLPEDLGVETGRRRGGGGGGGGKGGIKGMMGGMMMGLAAKLIALIPVAIAGLFLLAGKALITAKIALLISGIIALKKLFAAKKSGGGGGGGHGGWQPSGGGGGGSSGWQSSGGGWDKRSLETQKLAYSAFVPK